METDATGKRKIPIRSTMSDEELLRRIQRDREERPDEFSERTIDSSLDMSKFHKPTAVTEVIVKWL